jgi:hypothetical protein
LSVKLVVRGLGYSQTFRSPPYLFSTNSKSAKDNAIYHAQLTIALHNRYAWVSEVTSSTSTGASSITSTAASSSITSRGAASTTAPREIRFDLRPESGENIASSFQYLIRQL